MAERRVQVLSLGSGPALDLVEGDGAANIPVWPGIGAEHRSIIRCRLEAASRTSLLRHPSDAVYYVASGSGTVDDGEGASDALREGSVVHVDAGTGYRFSAGAGGMTVLGGPCPADPALTPAAS